LPFGRTLHWTKVSKLCESRTFVEGKGKIQEMMKHFERILKHVETLRSLIVNLRQVGSAMGPMALLGGAALTLVGEPMGFA
jgi:hypothetical protein